MLEINKLYNMDCLEGMKLIDDKSIDMILCDLPYGTTACKWDSVIDLDKLWHQYERIIKDNGAIVLFAQTPFDKLLGVSNIKMLRYEWIWSKGQGTGFLNAKKMPLKAHENILVFYKKIATYNPQMRIGKPYIKKQSTTSKCYGNYEVGITTENDGLRYPIDILEYSSQGNELNNIHRLHPTQKPVELCEYLIKTYTNKNDLVLDNCMGSGTTAIACINTFRKYLGFELDEHYYNLANKRLKEHQNQLRLDLF